MRAVGAPASPAALPCCFPAILRAKALGTSLSFFKASLLFPICLFLYVFGSRPPQQFPTSISSVLSELSRPRSCSWCSRQDAQQRPGAEA